MEITKREILFSIIIISVMIGIGVPIANSIQKHYSNKAISVIESIKVSEPSEFSYIGRTDVGDFMAEGTLSAIDSVSIKDINGYFLKIRKAKEVLTAHTRVVVHSNGKSTYTTTQVYYTWDEKQKWCWAADSVKFLGVGFKLSEIKRRDDYNHFKTINESSKVRYVYTVQPTKYKGVLFGNVKNKEYNKLVFKNNTTIDKVVSSSEKKIRNSSLIFWILWSILTIGGIVLFYYFENRWLED